MTYTAESLAELIFHNHTEFAGRTAQYGDILNTLRKTRHFLEAEGPARSANFDARIYIAGSYNSLPSVITVGLDGDGLTFREQRA